MPKSVVERLVATLREAGATDAVIIAAMQFMIAQEKRDKNAAKVARWRYKQVTNGLQEGYKEVTATEGKKVTLRAGEHAGSNTSSSSLQSEEDTPLPPRPSKTPRTDAQHEIEFGSDFWPAYPKKAGKAEALRAYLSARKRASKDDILKGLHAYRQKLIRDRTEERFIKHAQGWLNNDHWQDQHAKPTPPDPRKLSLPDRIALEKRINGPDWRQVLSDTFGRDDEAEIAKYEPDVWRAWMLSKLTYQTMAI